MLYRTVWKIYCRKEGETVKTFGTIIKVGMNKTDFERGSTEVNRNIRILDSSFKAVSSEAKAFGETTDTLRQKHEILSEKINIQSKRVSSLKDEYEKSKKETGENSVATDKLAVRYNNAVNSLHKMEGQINGVNTKLKAQQKAFKLNGEKIKEFSKKAIKNIAIVTGAITAMAGGMLKLASNSAKAADRIDKLSQRLGLSREEFQEWDYVLSQAGVDIDSLQSGMKTLVKRMGDVAKGSGESVGIFRELSVSVKETNGQMRSQEEVFNDVITALQKMPDGIRKAELAQKLFARSGQELLPLLNGSAESVEELKKKARELGLVLNDDAIDAGVKFTDIMDTFKRSLSAVTTAIGVGVIPNINEFVEKIIQDMPKIQKTIKKVADVVIPILSIVGTLVMFLANNIKIIIPLITTIGTIIAGFKIYKTVDRVQKAGKAIGGLTGFLKSMNPAALKTTAIILGVVAALIALVALITVLTGKTKDVERTFQAVGNGVGNITSQIPTTPDLPRYATGTNYITRDHVAIVHEGEAIIPKQDNPFNPNVKASGWGGDTFNFYVDASNLKEVNDIVEMANNARQNKRQYAIN